MTLGDVRLSEKLTKIRSSPKQQNQQQVSNVLESLESAFHSPIPQTAVILSAVEDTLHDQNAELTPTAYFAALLSLLSQYVITSAQAIANKEIISAVVYLLDLVTPHVPPPLLRSKFPQVIASLAPALTHSEAEAPLLRSAIGCIESLLVVQDTQAWAQSQDQVSPRRAIAGLLAVAADHRPKVRKRAQDALANILKSPPPSPSLDHPAADLCAGTALQSLKEVADIASHVKNRRPNQQSHTNEPDLIHALQLVRTIASASGGWPATKLDSLCELLLGISRSSNEYLTMTAFEVFEIILKGLATEVSSAKLPRLLEILLDLEPSQQDSQLMPPWIAVISRGYDVSSQLTARETFQQIPSVFATVSKSLTSSSHNIRVSASECLISFLVNCVPDSVVLQPSSSEAEVLEQLASIINGLLSVKFQAAWKEVFNVLAASFDALRWRSWPLLVTVVSTIGELRANDAFTGKKDADAVLGKAVRAMGPEKVLEVLPLNLLNSSPSQRGRAWLLPILRDSVFNTRLLHFRSELVPVSEKLYQKIIEYGDVEKNTEMKILETLVHQIWAILPGYCDLTLDVVEAFDQPFAEQISNLLYQQPELRTSLCRALENLVESNKAIASTEGEDDLLRQSRIPKATAIENVQHLAKFSGNLLAILFNVYSSTLPHARGHILRCINSYLSVMAPKELAETLDRIVVLLESALNEEGSAAQKEAKTSKANKGQMPPMSHTFMDLIITISVYLPRESLARLFGIASAIVMRDSDPQLQKKAYKLIPRLAESEIGRQALMERNADLQRLLEQSSAKTSAPARRDRLTSVARVVEFLPPADLHFIPSVLSEVVMSAKEVNEKARTVAFDLLVLMGEKMQKGGIIANSKLKYMPEDAPSATASLEEYFNMVAAGLVGSTPHVISASVTAITRLLYQFHTSLSEDAVMELLQTMDLFLTSANREIVRSVLGFVKVSIVSLPQALVVRRLGSLVPNLMVWSHEHKGHFKAKVKHIFERMIRRFGCDVVLRYCPEADKRLIINIRKTRDRRKRKKETAIADDSDEISELGHKPVAQFESEFDKAVHDVDESDESAGLDVSDDELQGVGGRKSRVGDRLYILEDEEEPLDLLDKRALGNMSSVRPIKGGQGSARKAAARTDLDGKLILGEDSDDEELIEFGPDGEPGDGTLEGGVNAYVAAIRGRDVAQRGQRGKLKFKNDKSRGGEQDEMEIDEESVSKSGNAKKNDHQKAKARVEARKSMSSIRKARGGRVVKTKSHRAKGQKHARRAL